jgi:hypothetical protein
MSRAYHVAVAIKGLDTSEKLLIIAKGDEDLGVIPDRLLEDGEGPLVDFVLLELADLGLVEVRLWLVLELAVRACQCPFSQAKYARVPHRGQESSGLNQTFPKRLPVSTLSLRSFGGASWVLCIIFANIS